MAYDRKKDFEEPLKKTLADIKRNQDAVAKRFELLIVRAGVRKGKGSQGMSEETYQNMIAFLDKLEELIDLELLDK